MIFSRILLTCTLLASAAIATQNYTVTDIPQCPLSCLLESVTASSCSLLDVQCQCTNKALFKATAKCVLANCSQSDDIILSKVQASICNRPTASRSDAFCKIYTIMLTIVTFTSILRYLSCWKVRGQLFAEDYIVIVALIITYTISALVYLMIHNGFGNHIYQITSDERASKILLYFWVSELVYVAQIILIKLSLVCFFLRIFPQRKFQYACYVLIGFITTSGIMWLFLLMFQCRPMSSNWNVKVAQPKCYRIQTYAYVGAGSAMLHDVTILIFPIPLLLRLKITPKQKLAVLALFSLGIFVIITSAIRLRYVSTLGNSSDPTWDNVDIAIWTALEVDVSLLCCNMPAIAGLLTKYHRKIFSSSPETSTSAPVAQVKNGWSNSGHPPPTPEQKLNPTHNRSTSSASDLDLESNISIVGNASMDWSESGEERRRIYGINETVVTSSVRKPHIANLIAVDGFVAEMERKKRLREKERGEVILVSRSVIVREEWDDRSTRGGSTQGFGNRSRASSRHSRSSSKKDKSLEEKSSLEEMFEPWPGEECE